MPFLNAYSVEDLAARLNVDPNMKREEEPLSRLLRTIWDKFLREIPRPGVISCVKSPEGWYEVTTDAGMVRVFLVLRYWPSKLASWIKVEETNREAAQELFRIVRSFVDGLDLDRMWREVKRA